MQPCCICQIMTNLFPHPPSSIGICYSRLSECAVQHPYVVLLTEVHRADSWFDGGHVEGEEVEALLSSWIRATFNRGKHFQSHKNPQITEAFIFYLACIVLWKSWVTGFTPVDASHCCFPPFPKHTHIPCFFPHKLKRNNCPKKEKETHSKSSV